MDHEVFTSRDGRAPHTMSALKWRTNAGVIQRVARAAYIDGPNHSAFAEALAVARAANGVNTGWVAARVLGADCAARSGPRFIVPSTASGRRPGAKRVDIPEERILYVDAIPVTDGALTLVELAADVNDIEWEWSLESMLFHKWTTVAELEAMLPELSRARTKGVRRMRRVLAHRPPGAPPTESLLETLMVQLARTVGAPLPTRQFVVWDEWHQFVARVDLCWPELGVFIELDGRHHAGQPIYDASRETAVVAATGWLCGRFTWDEVWFNPVPTGRRLVRVLEQARRRPL